MCSCMVPAGERAGPRTPDLTPQTSAPRRSFPGVSPHIGIPAAFVHFDDVEIGQDGAVIGEGVFFDHGGNESVTLVVVPTSLAHEAVVNEDLFVSEPPPVGEAPIEDLLVALSREHLRADIFIANAQITAGSAVETLAKQIVIIFGQFSLSVDPDF